MSPHHADKPAQDPEPQSLADLFHRIGSLIPKGQNALSVGPRATVGEALELMRQHSYSQLPVVAGDTVLGVFSYRSLSMRLLEMGPVNRPIGDLPVDEFTEDLPYVQPADNWESILDDLNRLDAVLVRSRDQLRGVLTAVDVLNYLQDIANPFVMLAEMERSLRRIIRACASPDELEACIRGSLSTKYSAEEMPADLSEMSLNDYVQIICDGRNWPRFQAVFGEGEWQRQRTSANLREVRDLRNDIFHFRRWPTPHDHAALAKHRKWLQMKVTQFVALQRKRGARPDRKPPSKRQWDEASFLEKLEDEWGAEAATVARLILQWAQRRLTQVWWGRGKEIGSFVPILHHKGRKHQLFAVYTYGRLEVYFQFYQGKPPFESEAKRMELLDRLNAIDGVSLPDDAITRRPSIALVDLKGEAVLEELLGVFDWVIEQIRAT